MAVQIVSLHNISHQCCHISDGGCPHLNAKRTLTKLDGLIRSKFEFIKVRRMLMTKRFILLSYWRTHSSLFILLCGE
jgi:hypothetical protein